MARDKSNSLVIIGLVVVGLIFFMNNKKGDTTTTTPENNDGGPGDPNADTLNPDDVPTNTGVVPPPTQQYNETAPIQYTQRTGFGLD